MAEHNRDLGPHFGPLELKVSDLDQAVDFYCALGLRIVCRATGAPIVFLGLAQPGAFRLGLGVVERSRSASPSSGDQPGLDHFARAYSSPAELADAG
jgi:catechol 2,3-dioxygenase-like lactoylglutathione lyase family enzyme